MCRYMEEKKMTFDLEDKKNYKNHNHRMVLPIVHDARVTYVPTEL